MLVDEVEYWEDAYGGCRERGAAVMVIRARRSAYRNRGSRIVGEQIKFLKDRISSNSEDWYGIVTSLEVKNLSAT